MSNKPVDTEELAVYLALRASSLYFVEIMWKLRPQPIKKEKEVEFNAMISLKGEYWEGAKLLIKADWFEPFVRGKHITWQQHLILLSVDKAMRGDASQKISIASGHGIGKSGCMSWIILWFLFCYDESQVPCTAPTADQIYDVLWKELNLWINKMPDGIKQKYEWQTGYIRMAESPETWFARAKTASKENSEALAGVHAEYVLTVADEASGVPEQIFNTAEGAWTSGNILVILISNPTRINGYFYDTHHKLAKDWQNMQFSSIDSPIVDSGYEADIAQRHGRDSTEYGIRVLGKFPREDSMDDSGYVSLLSEKNINTQPDFGDDIQFKSVSVLGVDPAGDGDDKTSWVIRDQFKARKLHEEAKSTAKSIAERTLFFIEKYDLAPRNVVVDAFGVGADVGKEIAIASKGKISVTTVNTGDLSEDETEQELYLNQRAEAFYKAKQWLQSGGELVENKNLQEELLSIKYKRNLKGKIQIMPKLDMKKKYGNKSPNDADAFSLTFLRTISKFSKEQREAKEKLLTGLVDDNDPIYRPGE